MENSMTEKSSEEKEVVTSEACVEVQVAEEPLLLEESSVEESKNDIVDVHIRGVIEALLFISEKSVTLEQLRKVLPTVSSIEIRSGILELQTSYEERKSGMAIVEIAGGYQMLSNSDYVSYIRDFYKTKHKEKLSKPALESLAIIAYKQPVTRSDVELIRGVNSDGVVNHLLSKELIKLVGRKDVAGRPYLYGTTKQFLEYFGLKSLNDLPKLEEFPSLLPPDEIKEEDIKETLKASEEQKEDIFVDPVESVSEVKVLEEELNNESE